MLKTQTKETSQDSEITFFYGSLFGICDLVIVNWLIFGACHLEFLIFKASGGQVSPKVNPWLDSEFCLLTSSPSCFEKGRAFPRVSICV
jgi:hypothetical protein